MASDRATVTCPDCDLNEAFAKLGDARERIEAHREATGHDPAWALHDLSPGVERAGDQAGVCGRPSCADADSPLVRDGE